MILIGLCCIIDCHGQARDIYQSITAATCEVDER